MKIKCVNNSGKALPQRLKDARLGLSEATQFHVTVGREYVVYGVTIFLGDVWYYICDDSFSYFPVWHPAIIFSVVDGRISRFWTAAYRPSDQSSDEAFVVSFSEWASDGHFYGRLTDGETDAVQLFKNYKQKMDAEFA